MAALLGKRIPVEEDSVAVGRALCLALGPNLDPLPSLQVEHPQSTTHNLRHTIPTVHLPRVSHQ